MRSVGPVILFRILLLSVSTGVFSVDAWAAESEGFHDLVRARLVADAAAVEPGGSIRIGVLFTIKPQWHIYWINPGEAGMSTTVRFGAPEGYEVGEIEWPLPIRFDAAGIIGYGYEREVLLTARVRVPKGAKPGENLTLTARADWLSCKVSCVAGGADLSLTLPIEVAAKPANSDLFEYWDRLLPRDPEGTLAVAKSAVGSVRLSWNEATEAVELYPATADALVLTDLNVSHGERETDIAYRPEIFDDSAIRDGRIRGLAIYRDTSGARRGVWVPLPVTDAGTRHE